ncbi:hypothetical protein KKG46_02040 [Patescibacteria group bacterium]|nr:hypothetical protein [Patescibacteria group bacterium]
MLKLIRNDEHKNPKIAGLVNIIHWQGRIIALLVLALIISLASRYVHFEFPSQKNVAYIPEFNQNDIQYYFNVYQNDKILSHGTNTLDPKVTILGQIYDSETVMEKWPDFTIFVNNAVIPITKRNGSFQVELNLKKGLNIIEVAYRVNGQEYDRRQTVINYIK